MVGRRPEYSEENVPVVKGAVKPKSLAQKGKVNCKKCVRYNEYYKQDILFYLRFHANDYETQ
jgi:hypothetical protein